MAKKQALGKGLSFLIPEKQVFESDPAAEEIIFINTDHISPDPEQPRRSFEEKSLKELAESIRQLGVMQPLLVVADKEGYRIVAGERRYRAAQLAGLEQLPCIVRNYSKSQLAEVSLVENIQRQDLNPMEEAAAYRRLMDEFGYTQENLSKRLGKSRPYVANTLRLLQLAPQYRRLVEEGRLSAGHARAALSLKDEALRVRLIDAVLENALSVRQTEELAKKLGEKPAATKAAPKKEAAAAAHFRDLEKQFRSSVGMPVKLSGTLNKGRLMIAYNSGDDLEQLIELLIKK